MKRQSVLAAVLAAVLGAAPAAQADLIAWSYNWEPSTMSLAGDGGSGKITLTDQPAKNASGNSDTVATNLRVFSSAPRTSPDTFTHAAYSLNLTLTDLASHQSGRVIFTGFFNGTVSASSSNLANTFTGPTMQQLHLGNDIYTVTIDKYSPPGPPGVVNSGSISAHIDSNLQVDPPPPVHSAPEPSSLLLAGLGVSGLCLGWRRLRQVPDACRPR
jgi:hypothetical protein